MFTGFSQLTRLWSSRGMKNVLSALSHCIQNTNLILLGIAHISILLYCFTVVHRQLPTLSILISTDEEIKNTGKASFSCLANDFSPKDYTITWLRNGVKIDEPQISTFSESKKTKDGTLYNAVSYIQMNENRWKDVDTVITCMFASDNSVNASVTYTPKGGGE